MDNYPPGLIEAATKARDHRVSRFDVSRRRQDTAELGARLAMSILGRQKTIDVRFFAKAVDTLYVAGAAAINDCEILIRNDLSPAETAAIAGHETAHALGIEDEAECTSIQYRVKADWIEYRSKHLSALRQQYKELLARINPDPDRWLGEPSLIRLQRWYGADAKSTVPDLYKLKLALDDWNFFADELEELYLAAPSNPTAHLRLRGTPAASPSYSFAR